MIIMKKMSKNKHKNDNNNDKSIKKQAQKKNTQSIPHSELTHDTKPVLERYQDNILIEQDVRRVLVSATRKIPAPVDIDHDREASVENVWLRRQKKKKKKKKGKNG